MTTTTPDTPQDAPSELPPDAGPDPVATREGTGGVGSQVPAGGLASGPASESDVTWVDRVEAFVSRLSTRDNFWHRLFSFLFLPLAFWSGIRMKRLDGNSFRGAALPGERLGDQFGDQFAAVLPFSRFNRNMYHAMAGGALLANSEIAGGMYVFGVCGHDYTVVCKHLSYTFLRPCLGPAIYKATPREDLTALVTAGGEFNVTLDLDVRQQGFRPGERDKRVGRCEVTFHVTPKSQFKDQVRRRRERKDARRLDAPRPARDRDA